MNKWIMTAAILLTSVTVAKADLIKCEIIQVIPGFFLQRCENTHRYEYRNHYLAAPERWNYKNSHRYKRCAGKHSRYDRFYCGKKRNNHKYKDIINRPYRRDKNRW